VRLRLEWEGDKYVGDEANGWRCACVVDAKESSKAVEGRLSVEDVLSSMVLVVCALPSCLCRLWQFSDNEADIQCS
jgi:hypothetical protein